ncbi:DivIVA domain-containing protein [Arthrobacter sp. GCM10027362]|uniref:DivIVA domain-containing protein n=1 Tax=Arthrobacter sp. GCM10027362 TaxID=3273379 RepID=UPI00363DB39E
MSFFLVFLAIAVAGVAAAAAAGRIPGRSRSMQPGNNWRRGEVDALGGLSEHEARLPAVLLPEHPRSEDIDSVRFSVALRGYRMDQVDQVLDALRAELAAKEALIRALARTGGAPEPEAAPGDADQ